MSFADLHRPGAPLVLPNAWDLGSAIALVGAGFPALGTTSLGVLAAHGLPDAARTGLDLTRRLLTDLDEAGLGVPVTCDLEDGFSDDPGRVADLVASLPVAGVNLEDATAGALVDPHRHAARIRAVKDAAPHVFVNARTDTRWLGVEAGPDVAETVHRLRIYRDAGADGVFVPGALDPAQIEAVVAAVDAPVNVLASPDLSVARLAGLGVARISTGSLLYRVALTAALEAADAVRSGAPVPAALPYDRVQALTALRTPPGRPAPSHPGPSDGPPDSPDEAPATPPR